jgi:hydrogenase-4 membrane subunit HyfE
MKFHVAETFFRSLRIDSIPFVQFYICGWTICLILYLLVDYILLVATRKSTTSQPCRHLHASAFYRVVSIGSLVVYLIKFVKTNTTKEQIVVKRTLYGFVFPGKSPGKC